MSKLPTRRWKFSVVGESRTNPDGTSRQSILEHARPGETVELVREPLNQADPNAIRVDLVNGTIGYLTGEDAALLFEHLDGGRPHVALLHEIRGGLVGAESFGAIVSIVWDEADPKPFIPLDERQLHFRSYELPKMRLAAEKRRLRKRDADGKYAGKGSGLTVTREDVSARKNVGCLAVLFLFALINIMFFVGLTVELLT